MAEEFGPDAEVLRRRQLHEAAMRRLKEADLAAQRFRVPYLAAGETSRLRGRVEADYDAAYEAAQRSARYYSDGVKEHPANQYAEILADSQSVKAPKLSGWDWWRQNPSLLEAVPLTDEKRDERARLAYVLKRVHEATTGRNPQDPLHLDHYRGPGSDHLADLQILAAEVHGLPGTDYRGNPEQRRQLESPYDYRPFWRNEDGELADLPGSPRWHKRVDETGEAPPDLIYDTLMRPMSAIYSGPSRFHDNFASGGAALSEGRFGDAAQSFAYALPNLFSPSFHKGGPGMPDDWRAYATPTEAAVLDTAAEVPLWFYRGVYRGRPGIPGPGRAGARIPALAREVKSWRDLSAADAAEANRIRNSFLRRYHPDHARSNPDVVDDSVMRRLNELVDTGDLAGLRSFARQLEMAAGPAR